MQADVICFAEELPFADGAFELAVTRVAAHHFADVAEATRELARVASKRVIVVDNLFGGADTERAEKLRDPSHVRTYSEAEWRDFFAQAGIDLDEARTFDFPVELEPWLTRTGCEGDEAALVRSLLADRIDGDHIVFERIAILGRPT
jgi:SAM-dependent methyltransferase